MERNRYLVGLIVLTFFVISFLTNIIGPLVPQIIEDFDLSLTLVAVLPFAFFIAYGVMSIPSGILIEKYGEKQVMILAFMIAFSGAFLFGLFPQYIVAVLSLFFIGSGMAMLQVAINPLLRVSGGEENFAFNSVMAQLFFGLASFLSPLVYSYLVLNIGSDDMGFFLTIMTDLVPAELPWVSLYWIFAFVSILMVLVITLSKFPEVLKNEDEKVGALETHLEMLKNKKVILFFLGIFAYVGAEQGVANWISEFLSSYHGYDPQTTGASTVSWFWGMMTAGTVLGLFLLKVMDSKKILVAFTSMVLICLATALFASGEIALYAFPAIGFFIAVMWPIIFSLALNSVKEHHGTFSGILVTGIAGGAVVPLIVGSIGDVFGLRVGMLFLFIAFGYILSIGFWAKPLVNNKTIDFAGKD
ncbi:MAG: sugar MFS transporter [Balneola sp.]|nr:sugar MFS transporter [Balneola sp.]MBO6652086.1 sugar MFS transporter [Balneola sp.]MBO6711573.1 sugar MFS transporter [Balneola sp.]MBO6799769.1 sugar MFS transporter [Balneola sp.]MBO6870790.1 sugar MFS transporter [Balneola sp.]